ncbi:UbiX family flavin prenyltransferase [Consotaella salsifontis]|uniref:Flavin prenyltransferase UbiX n=1 Tax=Consotaella salsifontis TaxID=1365950 RepID=A0A1T4TD85_9HYPH|nr:UbiX family flavin prenyltransferase [Consotaella salsifontis]SKA38179.1 4-hydroxy-3-polyprenylbenzoate decarboxylase [Consotaella salsifontis]
MHKRRIVVGVSGATGFIYAVKALELLRELEIETHLVVSDAAERTRAHETDLSAEAFGAMADVVYPIEDIGAAIASGSFQNLGMLIAPCSMRTLAVVASGATDNLLTRAADVALKERRRVVLMARETPLHLGHLRNMVAATEIGAIVYPPVPALYQLPQSIDAMVTHSVARALDLFGLDVKALPRWAGSPQQETTETKTAENRGLQ